MVEWDCLPTSLDAIVSLYALIHVPVEDHRDLIPRLSRWLTTSGYLVAIVGFQRWTGVEDYMGAPIFWDHADTDTYLAWLEHAGLEPPWHRFVPEGASGHTLILTQRHSTVAMGYGTTQSPASLPTLEGGPLAPRHPLAQQLVLRTAPRPELVEGSVNRRRLPAPEDQM